MLISLLGDNWTYLNESILIIWGIKSNFSFFFLFFDESASSGAILIAYVHKKGYQAYMCLPSIYLMFFSWTRMAFSKIPHT